MSIGGDVFSNFALALNTLFGELSSSGTAVQPIIFLQLLRSIYPQFAERDRNGFMQQDAEEVWGQLVQALNEKVPGLTGSGEIRSDVKFVDPFMTTEIIAETKCDVVPDEPASISMESVNKLRVNIGAGVSTYLVQEITNGLVGKLENVIS